MYPTTGGLQGSFYDGSLILSRSLWSLRTALDGTAGRASISDALVFDAFSQMVIAGPQSGPTYKLGDFYAALLTVGAGEHTSDIENAFAPTTLDLIPPRSPSLPGPATMPLPMSMNQCRVKSH